MKYDRVKGEKSVASGAYDKFIKRQKLRIERRRAKQDPECTPAYRKFNGYS